MAAPQALWPGASGTIDSLAHERSLRVRGYRLVAGTDEAGRGPLAGPVVAACVILPPGCDVERFQDSKQLSPRRRRELAVELAALPGVYLGVGVVEAAEIDHINILQASLLAMKKAVQGLAGGPADDRAAVGRRPDFLLVDGKHRVPLAMPQQTLVKGDCRSASIAAASIIAKVRRDEIMEAYHLQYPQYNFKRHKGYGTAEHRRLLREHGPCPIHRRSFKPVKSCREWWR